MALENYIDYQRREYCKDVLCPIQMEINKLKEGTALYETKRKICKEKCIHTTYEFHHWLIKQGYLIVKPDKQPKKTLQ